MPIQLGFAKTFQIGGSMQIKTGDLVRIKIPTERSNSQDIWLVLDKGVKRTGSFKGFIRVQNIHNGYTCQYIESMLMKIETDKK